MQRQRFVVNEAHTASVATHLTTLLAALPQFEPEGLTPFHSPSTLWSMADVKDIRRGRHCVFALHVHLVFLTKYRRCVFDAEAIEHLRHIFSKVCTDFGAQLVQMDGERDHVHLVGELSSEGFGLLSGELLEGRFQLRPPKPVASDGQVLLGKCSVIAFLFRRILWRRTARSNRAIH